MRVPKEVQNVVAPMATPKSDLTAKVIVCMGIHRRIGNRKLNGVENRKSNQLTLQKYELEINSFYNSYI